MSGQNLNRICIESDTGFKLNGSEEDKSRTVFIGHTRAFTCLVLLELMGCY